MDLKCFSGDFLDGPVGNLSPVKGIETQLYFAFEILVFEFHE